ncbi:thiosulfate/3-mercaptopyruvate sulfurtransferase [Roseomonas rosea]|uniref:Thiosulfate/3-mercaptopyruvate sulfurtransferase n=1 Tax=Muricoccus roseus TaxID=198092 RepID=A0A1M6E282_9PROT|nr:sulfurtransferase [Roseomonas rosea]SHI79509.1 thiosulfate/3-mercaptopyruvate sulfurtransferase [Roseomonas rosea]
MKNIVSTEWLAGELGKPDLVVLDCSLVLPGEPGDKKAGYLEARIPGARFFDIDLFADPDTDLPHMVPTPARFAKLAGALGISNDSRVIFYDQAHGLRAAARGWWLMRLMGHEAAHVLDGGLPKWKREGRPIESGEPKAAPAATFTPDFRTDRLRGIGDIKRIVRQGGGEALIIDARSAGRFDGTAPEPRPGLPNGHMPGAANIPFTELLSPEGTMLPPEALRARFERAGVDGERPVILSCGSGVTACVLALGLVESGLPEGSVYDGSWTEWALRPETPKTTKEPA